MLQSHHFTLPLLIRIMKRLLLIKTNLIIPFQLRLTLTLDEMLENRCGDSCDHNNLFASFLITDIFQGVGVANTTSVYICSDRRFLRCIKEHGGGVAVFPEVWVPVYQESPAPTDPEHVSVARQSLSTPDYSQRTGIPPCPPIYTFS